MTITDSNIFGNHADSAGGIANGGTLTIDKSTIDGNHAFLEAGGIDSFGNLTIEESTINGNGAGDSGGGGIEIAGGTMIIINSTIAENSTSTLFAERGGGGIQALGGTVNIINTTISSNSSRFNSDGGGGIFNNGGATVDLQNTILALNTLQSSPPSTGPDCLGPITSLGNNIIGDTTGCTITLQTSDLTGNPGLDTFTDNGTPGNGHFPLLSSSQAINAGNNAVCLANPILSTDQIGDPRVGICDIGSIEFEPFKNLGQCISTLIQQNCSGLQGNSRATCNKQQQTFCFNLFKTK